MVQRIRGEYSLKYNLQFFADGPGGEKTEPATAKKLQDAREEGQVAKSREVGNAFGLIALFIVLRVYVGNIGISFMETFSGIYNKIPDVVKEAAKEPSVAVFVSFLNNCIFVLLGIILPIFLIGFAVAFISEVIQVKWKITGKPLKPKFSRMNPLSGFKKIFSKQALFELVKSLLKIFIVIFVAYRALEGDKDKLLLLYDIPFKEAILYIGSVAINVGFTISVAYLIIALADFAYQKYKFGQDMKMTKQEVKDEYKNIEGNPEIKGRQKQRMREASQRRMMADLKEADVVITNPTHLAVGLRYDPDRDSAPVVVAKGADYVAQKIKEVAAENNIEIVENKPLARMLYTNVDLGTQIPPELYQAVAEVLAAIKSLDRSRYL
ncbi:MAG: flagellar biosynthesis protein FlhB [Lachnospiraceae bacterium]|nr:flagellar biosynthesis protein FlhB [Lachnospiraceae bacterium]